MAELLDNCRFTAGSTGTADFSDGPADASFRNLEDAGAEDGKLYPYKAQNATGSEWEIGRGTALETSGGWILERTEIQDSSNGGSAVDFSTPPKIVVTIGKAEIVALALADASNITGRLAANPGNASDCDTLVSSGWYQLINSTSNAPLAGFGTLFVLARATNRVVQQAFYDNPTPTRYIRWQTPSGWTSWEQLQNPLFLQGGTGAVSRPWQDKARERVTPLDYMTPSLAVAVSLRTATTSDAPSITAAFQAAINYCVTNQKTLFVPSGRYYLDDKLTASGPISIMGDGMMTTRLQWIGTATDAGIDIESGNNWRTSVVSDMAIETLQVGEGIALTFDYSGTISGGVAQPRAVCNAKVARVWIRGVTNYVTDGWLQGVKLISGQGCTIESCRINGYHELPHGTMPTSTYAVECTGDGFPSSLVVSNTWISAWQHGLFSEQWEGLYMTNCELVTVGTGVEVNNAAEEPVVYIVSSHIAAITKCIDLTNSGHWAVNNCALYPIGPVTGDFIGIHVHSGCSYGVVTNNVFSRSNITSLYRGIVEDGGSYTSIEGNQFSVGSSVGCIGIDLTENAVNPHVGANTYGNSNVRIQNACTTATFDEYLNFAGSLNDIVTSVRAFHQTHTLNTGVTDGPSGLTNTQGSIVNTYSYDDNAAVQFIHPPSQDLQYVRRKSGGTWQAWATLPHNTSAGMRIDGGFGVNQTPSTSGGILLNRAADNPFIQFTGNGVAIAQLRGQNANSVFGLTNAAGNVYFIGAKTSTGHVGVGSVGSGTGTPDRRLHVEEDNATNNDVTQILRLTHTTSGTPANGIGAGLEFEVETSASNNEVGATIEAVATDVTATSEDFDLVMKTMAGGAAAAERMRLKSTGDAVFRPPATAAALGTNGEVTFELTNDTTLTFKARGSDGTTRSGTITLA